MTDLKLVKEVPGFVTKEITCAICPHRHGNFRMAMLKDGLLISCNACGNKVWLLTPSRLVSVIENQPPVIRDQLSSVADLEVNSN